MYQVIFVKKRPLSNQNWSQGVINLNKIVYMTNSHQDSVRDAGDEIYILGQLCKEGI